MVSAIVILFNPELEIVLAQYNSLINEVDEVIYVDNGSKNYGNIHNVLVEKFRVELPQYFISNDKNQGLGYAQNQGIKLAFEHNTDFVLILDHDSVVCQNFINNLLVGYSSLINVGAVGPVYFNEETGEEYPITKYIGPFIKRIIPTDYPVEASMLISSGCLIPMSILKDVGLMNEDLFVDYIDVDWSYRARSKGYRLYAIPSAKMNHKIGDKRINVFGRMISQHSPLRRYYLSRNSIYMLKQPYISIGYKLRESVFNIVRIIIYAMISSERFKYLKYSFRGLKDGIQGKFGECSLLK